MAYGEIKVDTITFTDGGIDKSVTISGLVQNPTFSGNITVTGTISGNTVRGQTVSGVTVTGTTAQFTSGTFTTIDGGVATIASGVFASGNAAGPSVSVGTTTNGIYSPATNQIAIATSGTGRLFVASNGNVGVGAAPTTRLEVARLGAAWTGAAPVAGTAFFIHNGNNSASSPTYIQISAGNIAPCGIYLGDSDSNGSGRIIYDHATDSLNFYANQDERLRITSTGNVGIGTTSIDSLLHLVKSDVTAYNATATDGQIGVGPTIYLENPANLNNTVGGQIVFGMRSTEEQARIGATGGTGMALTFGTNDAERMRITSTGVGIGTSSPLGNLHIVSSTSTAGWQVRVNGVGLSNESGFYRTASDNYEMVLRNAAGGLSYLTNTGGASSSTLEFVVQGSERARIDSSGRLLVGTSSIALGSPQTIVQKTSSDIDLFRVQCGATEIAGNIAGLSFGHGPNGSRPKTAIGAVATGSFGLSNLVFYVDSTADNNSVSSSDEKMRIDTSGRVGIGTTSPSAIVHSTVSSAGVVFRGSHNNSGIDLYANDATGEARITATRLGGSGGKFLSFYTDTGTGEFERARIDSSGRLLVGGSTYIQGNTYTTGNLLNVFGGSGAGPQFSTYSADAFALGIDFSKSRSSSIGTGTIVQNGDALGNIIFNGYDSTSYKQAATITAVVDGTPGANDMPGRLVFSTTADGASSPTERMRITQAGDVGVGVISAGSSIAARLHVLQNADAIQTAFLENTSSSFTGKVLAVNASRNTTNGTYKFISCSISNVAEKFIVFDSGNAQNSNNSYAGISDVKLKENIIDATSQWDDIKALQVRKYNFKKETGQQTHTQIGLVAQEVELVSPGLVSESPDRDAEGNDLGTVTKSVNYSVLYMKAVKALQEAMERIETLEAKVAALERA